MVLQIAIDIKIQKESFKFENWTQWFGRWAYNRLSQKFKKILIKNSYNGEISKYKIRILKWYKWRAKNL
jgi:hypothetical protein